MIIQPNAEEQKFVDTLYETFEEMCIENQVTVEQIAAVCHFETWNLNRDAKKKAPPALLTLRRKCAAAGICMIELQIRTNRKMEQWQKNNAAAEKNNPDFFCALHLRCKIYFAL